jgi:alkylation response protein AidB-like acyl-CoA dehydrogenase
MDWEDTPEQAAFRNEVRTFIQERLPAYYRQPREDDEPENDWQFDMKNGSPEAKAAAREWIDALHERGWSAPHWPKEYGGGGLSTIEQFIYKQEFAHAGAPEVGGANGIGQFGPTLLVHGTEEQKRKMLPPTLSGEYLWAQGYSEPGAGSDLASLQTRAVREGDEWVVNGQKLWTSNAHKSNWIFMLVRTDPDAPKHRGISFLYTSMEVPGLTVRPIISGGWQHATNETFYEDVHIPADQIVGEENRGWYVGMTLLDFERAGIAGASQQRTTMAEMAEAMKSDPLARKKLIRNDIADRTIETEVGYNLSLRIASMQARGMIPNYEASMGKMFSSELSQRIARTGTKVFVLYGNIWSLNDEYTKLRSRHTHAYFRTIPSTIAGGSSEIQRNIIATRGLGLPRG